MTLLWSREHQKGPGIYIDLFENVPDGLKDEFIEWDSKLLDSQWECNFLGMKMAPHKSNTTAQELNNRGDECFEREEWHQAIAFYNQGICFAQPESVRLGVLFSKRGYCFAKLQMFDKGIKDVEIALSKNFPVKSEPDLKICQADWSKEVNKTANQNEQSQRIIPELSFDADDIFPCMANVLEMTEDGEFETHFVAKADIDVGQVVLVEEAFVSISNGNAGAHCFTCFKSNMNFIPCPRCTDAMFCNNDCLERSKVHKISCDEAYNRMPTDIKFVLHSILEAIVLFPSVKSLMHFVKDPLLYRPQSADHCLEARISDYGLFLSLISTAPSHDLPLRLIYQVYKTLMSMPSIESRFDCKTKTRFLMHLISHHAIVLTNYGFEKDLNQFRIATMPIVVALFEHSCAPNLTRFTIDSREIFVTIRPVKAGDCLYYDYWFEGAKSGNREDWMETQGINCECGKCEHHTSTNQRMSSEQSFFFITNYNKHFDSHTSPILKSTCINFLRKFKYEEWTREMDIVTKAYIRCLSAEFDS